VYGIRMAAAAAEAAAAVLTGVRLTNRGEVLAALAQLHAPFVILQSPRPSRLGHLTGIGICISYCLSQI
jgi:hypothetical protein